MNGVTTLGRYGFTFTGGAPSNFATPVMDGSGQVVGGSATRAPANPSQVYLGPIALSLTPAKAPAAGDISVAINGRRLAEVTAVYVGTLKADIVSRKSNELIFKRPALSPGRYIIRVVSDLGEFTFDGLVIEAARTSAPGAQTTKTISGFLVASSVLTAEMRAQIRQSMDSAPRSARVTCKGSTSGPISLPRDQVLADQRSKAACAFISRIRPDLETVSLKGKPNNSRAAELRSVRIRILG